MLVLVDADPIVYRAGFAGEKHERHYVVEYPDGTIREEIFYPTEGKTAYKKFQEWAEKYEKRYEEPPYILEEAQVVVPEPLDHILATVRAILRDVRYAVAEQFNIPAREVHLRVLLSGPDNFREQIATCREYKGNRKDTHKPYWYQQIRNYLTDSWQAEVISGREADDECSIQQHQADGRSVIATIDKDLDQVPGWHYDYVKKSHYYTSDDEGLALFYKQVLSGDSTDNIPGAYRVGAAAARRIVDEYLLDHPGDWSGLWQRILEVYQETLDKHGDSCCYYDKAQAEGVEAVAIEMARLVKMQEYEGQLWTPPGMDDELLDMDEGYE